MAYTQSENNSVTFTVEQSSNGTTGWSTLMNTTSTNGTHTRSFTPTAPYVRVRYSSSAAFSLAQMSLSGIDVDTSYSLIARGGYRYGFNSMEKDDELKGSGNSYDFGARMLDTRLGRWLTIDPLASKYPSLSPYVFVANSPLIFVDPDGEKIIFSDNLSSKELEDYKSNLKILRKGSPTFKKMYRDLKKSDITYTFDKTDVMDGDEYDPDTKTIAVNFNGNTRGFTLPTVIAHEVGHGWRNEKGLDVQKSESPYDIKKIEAFVFDIKVELLLEYEGLHIENVVRSELGIDLRELYGTKPDYTVFDKYKKRSNENMEYVDFSKKKTVEVKIDSNYDYKDKKQNNYKKMKERKHTSSEINIYKNEDPKKYN